MVGVYARRVITVSAASGRPAHQTVEVPAQVNATETAGNAYAKLVTQAPRVGKAPLVMQRPQNTSNGRCSALDGQSAPSDRF